MQISRIFAVLPFFAVFCAGEPNARDFFKPTALAPLQRPSENSGSEFKSDVSGRNLLGLDRPTPFSLPASKNGIPLEWASAAAETLNVLVLKIEFQREVPDNPKTTGDGTFDLRSYNQFVGEEEHYIDPGPHNTSYFNSHMEALRRYWYFVSDKKLDLTWDIYPRAESLAFRLPATMSYYGSDGPWTDVRDQLGNFFIDAVTFADTAAPQIDFSAYQSIILFHAGSDQQNNIPFIYNTPDDFYTGFLILAEAIPVDGGAGSVQEGLIVPETASQDNRVTAINAVLAHEFGHQLGLIDLYNTNTFLTQVGDFALMDNNGMSVGVQFPDIRSTVGGTLPVYPCAWSRAFLGFNIPREMTGGVDIPLSAAALEHDSEIVKIPITDFEYFLVENRQPDVDTLEPGYPFDDILIGDSLTGVILGPGFAYFDAGDTILVADSEYDRLLPGRGGALIWHVDEYVAYQSIPGSEFNNYQTNSLQWNKDRRFVTLLEADGVIDFGGNYYRGYGTDGDYYKPGNNTMLTPFTRPSSESNLGGDTHVSITNFSVSDTVMTFDLDIDWFLPGWPQMSHPQVNSSPLAIDLDNDNSLEVVTIADSRLLIHRADGEKFVVNSDSIGLFGFDGSLIYYPWAVAAVCDTAINGRPVPVDFDGDGYYEIAVSTFSGALYAFSLSDDDLDGRIDNLPGFPIQISNAPLVSLGAVDFDSAGMKLFLAGDNGDYQMVSPQDSVVQIGNAGGVIASVSIYSVGDSNFADMAVISGGYLDIMRFVSEKSNPYSFSQALTARISAADSCHVASGDIDRDGDMPEIIAVTSNSIVLIEPEGIIAWRMVLGPSLGRPALGDINADGFAEIVVAGDSRIYAVNRLGILMTGFPVDLSFVDLNGVIEAEPVIGDVDGDDKPDIIVGLPDGGTYAFNFRGDLIGGFPLPSSFEMEKSAGLADLDNDGDLDLLAVDGSGAIAAWDLSALYAAMNQPWAFSGGDIFNRGYLPPLFNKPVIENDRQLPEGSVYNYPNPASNSTAIRFYLNSDSDITIDVFDFMGEKVESTSMRGVGHADNEYVWNCAGISSGIYFCRVEADDGTDKEWRMIKIALVK